MKQSPIYYNSFKQLNDFLKINSSFKVFFLVDENTHEHCLSKLLVDLEVEIDMEILEIPAGESSKSIEITYQLWQSLSDLGADRNSVLINCGGGVVTDLGGFLASTFKRGIRFINIPTSLLSMVDASVGGKTGIDLNEIKNQIGTFAQAEMVLISPQFLSTLPKEELLSGFAEMLKHGLIRDKKLWEELIELDELNHDNLNKFIEKAVEIKHEIVEKDPKEKGLRKILNAGHTLGHALETYYLQKNKILLHGFAVAYGLVIEAYISFKKDLLSIDELNEINKEIAKFYPKIELPNIDDLWKIMIHDKKNIDGQVHCSLLNKIGEAELKTMSCTKHEIEKALKYYDENY